MILSMPNSLEKGTDIPLRINQTGGDNGSHVCPTLVEVGHIKLETIRSLFQSPNSQSDKHISLVLEHEKDEILIVIFKAESLWN